MTSEPKNQVETVFDLKVEKVRFPIKVLMADQHLVEGNLFLSPTSRLFHHRRELVRELLNSEERFLSLEVREDRALILFLNKTNLVKVILGERDLTAETDLAQRRIVKIMLINGETISGNLIVEMPEGTTRLSDFLNSHPNIYLYVARDDTKDVILNLDYIKSIQSIS